MEATIPSAAVTLGGEQMRMDDSSWDKTILREVEETFRAGNASREREFQTNVINREQDANRLSGKLDVGFTAGAIGSAHTNELLTAKAEGVKHHLTTGFTAASLAGCHTDELIATGVKDLTISSQVGFSALGVQLASTTNALSVQSDKNAGELSVQATNNYNLSSVQATTNANLASQQLQSVFNALTVQATLNRNDILLDSSKNAAAAMLFAEQKAAAAILLATQIAAAAARDAAECCCELKAGQIREADRVIGVVQANELADLRARMARLVSVAPTGTVV